MNLKDQRRLRKKEEKKNTESAIRATKDHKLSLKLQ